MSERKYERYFQMLTYRSEHLKGKTQEQITEMMNRNQKNCLEALSKRAAKKGWQYRVVTCGSDTNPRTGKRVRPHGHLVISGTPARAIVDWIKEYWETRYGRAYFKKCNNIPRIERYMYAQCQFMKERVVNCNLPYDQVLSPSTSDTAQITDITAFPKANEPVTCLSKDNAPVVKSGTIHQVPQPHRDEAAGITCYAGRQYSK